MDNRTQKMFWIFHNQLINTLDKQVFYFIEKDDENIEVARQEILSTIERLQLLINPLEDHTDFATKLFNGNLT